ETERIHPANGRASIAKSDKGVSAPHFVECFEECDRGLVAKRLTHFGRRRRGAWSLRYFRFVLLKAVVAATAEVKFPVFVGAFEGEWDFLGTSRLQFSRETTKCGLQSCNTCPN